MAADNDDIKAKMRAALDKKNAANHPADSDAASEAGREKTHGPEVTGAVGPKMHRRKSGGGGS